MNILSKYIFYYKNLGFYLLASLIPMLASVISNPFIAKNMNPKDYAIVGYFTSFNQLFAPFIIFSFITYYIKRYFEQTDEERLKTKANIIQALTYFAFGLTILCFILLQVYHFYFNRKSEIPFFPYALISIFSLPLTGLYSIQLAEFKMKRNSLSFFKLSLSLGILVVLLSLLLVVFIKLGALGRLSAIFIANLIIFIYCVTLNRDSFKQKFDWKAFKLMLIFSAPLTFAAMLEFFSSGYDRVLLERGGNLKELGIFVVGLQIAGYLNIFSTSIGDTFQPDLFKSIIERNKKQFLKIAFINIGLITIIVLSFIILAPFIIDILTAGTYLSSTKYAIIIAFAAITKSLNSQISTLTIALGETVLVLINRVICSALCIIMFTFLIERWTFIGAAWGIVFSYIILSIINFILLLLSQKKITIKNRKYVHNQFDQKFN